MQEDSHNYKALTIIYDPISQRQGDISQGRKHTHTHNEIKKLGQSQRQGWEQSYRQRSHRKALATEAQSWSKGGQSLAVRSIGNVSLTVFLQALIASPPASLKSVLNYTLQAKSNFSASS